MNMNTTAASLPGGVLRHSGGGHPKGLPPNDLSSIQGEVSGFKGSVHPNNSMLSTSPHFPESLQQRLRV